MLSLLDLIRGRVYMPAKKAETEPRFKVGDRVLDRRTSGEMRSGHIHTVVEVHNWSSYGGCLFKGNGIFYTITRMGLPYLAPEGSLLPASSFSVRRGHGEWQVWDGLYLVERCCSWRMAVETAMYFAKLERRRAEAR